MHHLMLNTVHAHQLIIAAINMPTHTESLCSNLVIWSTSSKKYRATGNTTLGILYMGTPPETRTHTQT